MKVLFALFTVLIYLPVGFAKTGEVGQSRSVVVFISVTEDCVYCRKLKGNLLAEGNSDSLQIEFPNGSGRELRVPIVTLYADRRDHKEALTILNISTNIVPLATVFVGVKKVLTGSLSSLDSKGLRTLILRALIASNLYAP